MSSGPFAWPSLVRASGIRVDSGWLEEGLGTVFQFDSYPGVNVYEGAPSDEVLPGLLRVLASEYIAFRIAPGLVGAVPGSRFLKWGARALSLFPLVSPSFVVMSQAPSPSQTSGIDFSRRMAYESAKYQVSTLSQLLPTVGDRQAARDWVVKFGASLVARVGSSVDFDPMFDQLLVSLQTAARSSIGQFAMKEWLELAPSLVSEWRTLLEVIGDDMTLGEMFPAAVAGLPPSGDPVPIDSVSLSSVSSPAGSQPSPVEPVKGPSSGPTLRPRAGTSRPQVVSPVDTSSSATVRPPLPSLTLAASGPTIVLTPAPPVTRLSRKRSAAEAVSAGSSDVPASSGGWVSCAQCAAKPGKLCVPPPRSAPGYRGACAGCRGSKVKCSLVLTLAQPKARRRKLSPQSPTGAKPSKAAVSKSSAYALPADGKFPAVPPTFLLHGTSSVPVHVFNDWRAEVVAAQQESTFAESCCKDAKSCLSTAWANYFHLLGTVSADQCAQATLEVVNTLPPSSSLLTAPFPISFDISSLLELTGAAFGCATTSSGTGKGKAPTSGSDHYSEGDELEYDEEEDVVDCSQGASSMDLGQ
ncbi:hypothetical protein F5888DRAFT_1805435 [Russula emetica]|nr:hypothetical protein F5888DRAFT_1805435 [Russula emetica]